MVFPFKDAHSFIVKARPAGHDPVEGSIVVYEAACVGGGVDAMLKMQASGVPTANPTFANRLILLWRFMLVLSAEII